MKELIVYLSAAVLSFIIGYAVCYQTKIESIKASEFQWKLIEQYDVALADAEKLLDKHNIFDKDGSDDMCNYMESCKHLDSLWMTKF